MHYEVTDIQGGNVIATGQLMDFDSFAITESPYADYVSEDDLKTRILISLTQELRLQLIWKLAGIPLVK